MTAGADVSTPDLQHEAADAAQLDPPGSASRRLTLLYVFALSTVAVLSVGAQWLIQHQLRTGESDSRVVNVAGRQRMLSQRLAKSALRLKGLTGQPDAEAREELCDTLKQWSTAHHALQHGDDRFGLPAGNSRAVQSLFTEIAADYDAMRAAAERLCEESGDFESAAIGTIQNHEARFLAGMDRIVSQYVVEAEHRVARLQRLEWTILSLTLLVLLVEGLVIFRPAVRRIRNTVARLSALGDSLRQARDEAEEANAAKTRFLANVSHELRTPMTAVLGMTELAQRSQSESERREYLTIVEEAGETLLGLLNDLIDLSQIDSDRVELSEQAFSPAACVHRVVRMMRPRCEEKGLELVVTLSEHATPRVVGDPRRIEQVLINFVSNAIKWTDAGRIEIACDADTTPVDSSVDVRFTVIDTGVGIAPEDQQRVFEPFAQVVDGDCPSRGGVGLGLSICQRIAVAMGGRIDLESEVDSGTTLSLVASFRVAEQTHEALAAKEASGGPASVLVVEDTEANRHLLREQLRADGRIIQVAATGEEAIEVFRDADFDTIVIDYQLPGIDGVETATQMLIAAIESRRRKPRLVCVTAHAGPIAETLGDSVFDAVVTKPVRRNELLGAIAPSSAEGNLDTGHRTPASLESELAEIFLGVIDQQREELKASVAARRWSDAAVVAHRFKGQVAYFDVPDLMRSLAVLECECQTAEPEASDLVASIDASMLQLKNQLRTMANATLDVARR